MFRKVFERVVRAAYQFLIAPEVKPEKIDRHGHIIRNTLYEQLRDDNLRRVNDWWSIYTPETRKKKEEEEEIIVERHEVEESTEEEIMAMMEAEKERRAQERQLITKIQNRFKRQMAMYRTGMPRFLPTMDTIPEYKVAEFSPYGVFGSHKLLIVNSKTTLNFRELREKNRKWRQQNKEEFINKKRMKIVDQRRTTRESAIYLREIMAEYKKIQEEKAEMLRKKEEREDQIIWINKRLKKQMKKDYQAIIDGTLTCQQESKLKRGYHRLEADYIAYKEQEREKMLRKQEKKKKKKKKKELKKQKKEQKKEQKKKAKEKTYEETIVEDIVEVPLARDSSTQTMTGFKMIWSKYHLRREEEERKKQEQLAFEKEEEERLAEEREEEEWLAEQREEARKRKENRTVWFNLLKNRCFGPEDGKKSEDEKKVDKVL
ncbi:uncharacterized protein LOC143942212 [Lithobates pipiens]